MELDPFDGHTAMPQPHYVAILGPCRHLERFGDAGPLDGERVIARRHQRFR
jgi:hypothetical protein